MQLIAETKSDKLKQLIKHYKLDPHKARVIFFNSSADSFVGSRIVLYEEDSNFNFVLYTKKYGISTTNKMYSREVVSAALIYKNGKFYKTFRDAQNKKHISQLTFDGISTFISGFNNGIGIYNVQTPQLKEDITRYFVLRFPWMRYVFENYIFNKYAVNTFMRRRLYSFNAAARYFLKVPIPVVRIILSKNKSWAEVDIRLKIWPEQRKVLKNVENLTLELYHDLHFNDSCRMAKTLGRKINCSWGLKRMKAEHDAWAREISIILVEAEEVRSMSVNQIYKDFAEHSGYHLLKTNFELILEGRKQRHCVATYVNKVDRGECAIYHIAGYTLEVGQSGSYGNRKLCNLQLHGFSNSLAPSELVAEIQKKLDVFNNIYELKKLNIASSDMLDDMLDEMLDDKILY